MGSMGQQGLLYPKPTRKKKRPAKTAESVICTNKKICYLCDRHGKTTPHHLLEGPDRAQSNADGLIIHLCFDCHRKAHDDGQTEQELHRFAQRWYEEHIGTRAEFMSKYRKNYL